MGRKATILTPDLAQNVRLPSANVVLGRVFLVRMPRLNVKDQLRKARVLPDRWAMMDFAVEAATAPGSWAEFGVAKGRTARRLLELLPADKKLYLFDSWLGLPEPWGEIGQRLIPAGHFACKVRDFDDDRAIVKQGLFEDTLPGFSEHLAFLHIDSDLESSARTVLKHVRFGAGSVLLFDEFHEVDRSGCPVPGTIRLYGEGRAWAEVEHLYRWRFLGRCTRLRAAILILGVN